MIGNIGDSKEVGKIENIGEKGKQYLVLYLLLFMVCNNSIGFCILYVVISACLDVIGCACLVATWKCRYGIRQDDDIQLFIHQIFTKVCNQCITFTNIVTNYAQQLLDFQLYQLSYVLEM